MSRRYAQPRGGAVELLERILTGSADLAGANCRGLGPLFDPDVPAESLGYAGRDEREEAIAATCVSCPVRGQCWAWASELSMSYVVGPTAATASVPLVMRHRPPGRPPRPVAALQAAGEPPPAPEDPEPAPGRPRPAPAPAPPRPARRRGARSRVRPSIHRARRIR
jgi:hypothetical protein